MQALDAQGTSTSVLLWIFSAYYKQILSVNFTLPCWFLPAYGIWGIPWKKQSTTVKALLYPADSRQKCSPVTNKWSWRASAGKDSEKDEPSESKKMEKRSPLFHKILDCLLVC